MEIKNYVISKKRNKPINMYQHEYCCRTLSLFKLESTIPFRVCVLLDSQAFEDVHVYFVSLTALMTRVNDHWSDDHVGTVVIRDLLLYRYIILLYLWLYFLLLQASPH